MFPSRERKSPRSPVPRRSLPQAGESLRELLDDQIFGHLLFLGMAAVLGVVALTAWFFHWRGQTISPWAWTVFAAVMIGVSTWRWLRFRRQMPALGLGIRGERTVGRMLERLRPLGYEVFHDIPGKGFNVDHVLLGPGGAFAIETKALTKPPKEQGRATIQYDGQRVLVNGGPPDRDPVAQARAVADHVREILHNSTGRTVMVRPVVLYPGWWVEPERPDAQVWVLNPDRLRAYLERQPIRLSREDVALYADRLTLHLSPELPA